MLLILSYMSQKKGHIAFAYTIVGGTAICVLTKGVFSMDCRYNSSPLAW